MVEYETIPLNYRYMCFLLNPYLDNSIIFILVWDGTRFILIVSLGSIYFFLSLISYLFSLINCLSSFTTLTFSIAAIAFFSSSIIWPIKRGGSIDTNTAKAIRNDNRLKGIGPKDDVSQERIWEEFKKAWKQAIDFNDYLNFFTEFDMWEQVFPGSKINTDLIESKDFVVVMANLFKNESTNGLQERLVEEYKIPNSPDSGKIATQMIFLINLLGLTIDEVPEMYKKKVQCSIKDTTILEWLDVNSINDPVKIKFVEFKPSVSSKELMDRGITGRELGVEIKRLEIENFKKLL